MILIACKVLFIWHSKFCYWEVNRVQCVRKQDCFVFPCFSFIFLLFVVVSIHFSTSSFSSRARVFARVSMFAHAFFCRSGFFFCSQVFDIVDRAEMPSIFLFAFCPQRKNNSYLNRLHLCQFDNKANLIHYVPPWEPNNKHYTQTEIDAEKSGNQVNNLMLRIGNHVPFLSLFYTRPHIHTYCLLYKCARRTWFGR